MTKMLFDWVLNQFPGWKAALIAVGQVGLGVHMVSQGDLEAGLALIATGFGILFESRRS